MAVSSVRWEGAFHILCYFPCWNVKYSSGAFPIGGGIPMAPGTLGGSDWSGCSGFVGSAELAELGPGHRVPRVQCV